jgi:hypothetical protein
MEDAIGAARRDAPGTSAEHRGAPIHSASMAIRKKIVVRRETME